MAANVELGAVLQITFVGRYCGQTTMNTYPHVVTAIPTPNVTYNAFAEALNVTWQGAGKLISTQRNCCPQNWEHVSLWVQQVRSVRMRAAKVPVGLIGMFTETDGLTANVQASIERFGELANRHEIGAVRIPIGTDDSCFDEGEITPALKTALELHGVQMAATTTSLGVTIKPLVGLGAPTYPVTLVAGTEVKDTCRVIRRRTVRVGI